MRYRTPSGQFQAIRNFITEMRNCSNLTKEQLASKLGTTVSMISRIENGNLDIPLFKFFQIASICNVKIAFQPNSKKEKTLSEQWRNCDISDGC